MNFAKAKMRPGTVLETSNNGILRAEVPGLFHKSDLKNLPPIRPFPATSSNNFSTPAVGEEVWVLFFEDNPEELRWFRKEDGDSNEFVSYSIPDPNDPENNNLNIPIQDLNNVEIISNKQTGMGYATIFFSDGTGWVIQNQMVSAKITNSGVVLTSGMPHGTIDINKDGISLGTVGTSDHPACYGDKTADLINKLIMALDALAETAFANPYTSNMGSALKQSLNMFRNDVQYICSDYVTID